MKFLFLSAFLVFVSACDSEQQRYKVYFYSTLGEGVLVESYDDYKSHSSHLFSMQDFDLLDRARENIRTEKTESIISDYSIDPLLIVEDNSDETQFLIGLGRAQGESSVCEGLISITDEGAICSTALSNEIVEFVVDHISSNDISVRLRYRILSVLRDIGLEL